MLNTQQKKSTFEKWTDTCEEQMKSFSGMTKKDGQNNLRNAIKKLSSTMKVFKESYQWWKHSVDPDELHKAEKEFKRISSLHTKLELEYNRK